MERQGRSWWGEGVICGGYFLCLVEEEVNEVVTSAYLNQRNRGVYLITSFAKEI